MPNNKNCQSNVIIKPKEGKISIEIKPNELNIAANKKSINLNMKLRKKLNQFYEVVISKCGFLE